MKIKQTKQKEVIWVGRTPYVIPEKQTKQTIFTRREMHNFGKAEFELGKQAEQNRIIEILESGLCDNLNCTECFWTREHIKEIKGKYE